jgi:hypothetical protein
VSFRLLVAPPGAGKTELLLTRARSAALAGSRVWWVGLAAQRAPLYRRATEAGALLGLAFLTPQQVMYTLLGHALRLEPLILGTGRLAMVGEALATLRDELPSPGEAGLFVRAISEAKRFGLSAEQLPEGDAELARLREIYVRYQRIKGQAWDYDDFLIEALALAENLPDGPEADLIVVDGQRTLGPLELRLYRALGRHTEVWVSLPEAPPGERATDTLPPVDRSELRRYRAPNPVSEARWALRAIKRDLAEGFEPLDLAVIAPSAEVRAFASLADEYGVPLMDETPRALADTLPGRLLLDLLELPDAPTASRLLAIPELAPLANAALERGIAGLEAIDALAVELGLAPSWHRWRALLEVDGDELGWARTLVDSGLPAIRRDLLEREELGYARFREHALQRAQEARRVGRGASFRAWWAALLQETFLFERPRGGVALLTAGLATGRRWRRAYVLHAVEGSYRAGEAEDYFVPEELRSDPIRSYAELKLPVRFQGRDRALVAELLSRADVVTVTAPEADQSGPLAPDPDLIGADPAPLPELPAASRLELGGADEGWRAPLTSLALGDVAVEGLRRYHDCPFRYWAEGVLVSPEPLPWRRVVAALRDHRRLNPARFAELVERFPEVAPWLERWHERLGQLTFGVVLPEGGEGPRARLDAAGRSGDAVTFVRFVAPGSVRTRGAAAALLDERWSEYWAAGHMLERYRGRVRRVFLEVWPLGGEPISVVEGGIDRVWRRIAHRRARAAEALRRHSAGDVSPNPGFRCRACPVADLCREGAR